MSCKWCPSSNPASVLLIISIWTQLLCDFAIVTMTAFFSEKGVDAWSYLIFSTYLIFGTTLFLYTIWEICNRLKPNPNGTTNITWISILCTTLTIAIFSLIYNYNQTVLQNSKVDTVFEIASHFLWGALVWFLTVFIVFSYQPAQSLKVSGCRLITLFRILLGAGIVLDGLWVYFYYGKVVHVGLFVGSALRVTSLIGLCFFLHINMRKEASTTIKLGRVIQSYIWIAITLPSLFILAAAFCWFLTDNKNLRFDILPFCYIQSVSFYAYFILIWDMCRCVEGNDTRADDDDVGSGIILENISNTMKTSLYDL